MSRTLPTPESLGIKALDLVFGELMKQIVIAKDKAIQYKPKLQHMQDTIMQLKPIAMDIEDLNRLLDEPDLQTKRLMQHIKEGESLVKECAETVRWWNCCWKKPSYFDKIVRLDDDIKQFVSIILQVQQVKIEKTILFRVEDVKNQLTEIGRGNGVVFGGGVGTCSVPEAPKLVVGLDLHVTELKIRFKSGTDLIVVSAPPGCGKTTLALKFCHDEEVKVKYKENIFFIAVSKSPNLETIISRMFKHKHGRVPEFQSEDDAVNQLEELLRRTKSPVLLVLDDVWFHSEHVVEKFLFRIPDYKILLTSRSVFLRFDNYPLMGLDQDNSMILFRDAACLNREDAEIQVKVVNKIVDGCKGIPLVLKVVGRSLCRQPPIVWQTRLQEWRSGKSILESESDKEILHRLRTCLDFPASKAVLKDCFLDLGSFPEDQRIPVVTLVDMWTELHGFDKEGIQSVTNIYELCFRNLATLIITREKFYEFENNFSQHFVTQHDILRELAIVESSTEPIEGREKLFITISNNVLPSWWKDQDRKSERYCARLLAISTDESFSSAWPDLRMPDVEVMVVNFWGKKYSLPEFVNGMKKMKVFIITNYGSHPAELSNFHPILSLPDLRRVRMEHVLVPQFFVRDIELKNLRKLSFVMCKIGDAFKNCNHLIPGVLPDLVELCFDYCEDLLSLPSGFCNILKIQKLLITNCHKLTVLPREIGKLTNLEQLRLSSCTGLSKLPETIGKLEKLAILDVSDCLRLEAFPSEIGELQKLNRLDMRKCLRVHELPKSVTKLQALEKAICDQDGARLWKSYVRDLPKLNIDTPEEAINLNWLWD